MISSGGLKNLLQKMKLKIDIDTHSGFCYGVVRAIEQAEKYLEENSELHSLGSIVHNSTEISRLKEKGLNTINYDELSRMRDSVVFIRAHGEPPSSYKTARENNLTVIDCTCPVVLKLQERVKNNYKELKKVNGQLVIVQIQLFLVMKLFVSLGQSARGLLIYHRLLI